MGSTKRVQILDLFCGAGGASMGLHQAFPDADITGVDINPQKRYPFKFIQADAMTFPLEGYDFIWASPPCQAFTLANHTARGNGTAKVCPNLIPGIRKNLKSSGVPYIIENVPQAPLNNPIVLCGTMFGLGIFRHRHFESSFLIMVPSHPKHNGKIGDGKYFSIAGGGGRWKSWGKVIRNVSKGTVAEWRNAMGISWMTGKELTQAIPPAYSKFIGEQLKLSKGGDICGSGIDTGGDSLFGCERGGAGVSEIDTSGVQVGQRQSSRGRSISQYRPGTINERFPE